MSAHDPFLVFALDSKDCVLFDFSAQFCFLRTVICKKVLSLTNKLIEVL